MLHKKLSYDEIGNRHALYQIVKYAVWIVSILLALDTAGIKVTVFLAVSAALMVRIGLRLQQIFNDIVSEIIILLERTIKLGDILQVDDDIVKIENIGMRTSKCLNRDKLQ